MTQEEFANELNDFLVYEVAVIRNTLPYKTGLLSGKNGSGGFHLERNERGFKIVIDESIVFYAKYVNDPDWVSKKTGNKKRTADFWNKLVVNKITADIIEWSKKYGTD